MVGKKALFPGLDLHTRCRYRFLSRCLLAGDVETLDAGSGNGALTYAAYARGSRVLGVSMLEREVDDTRAFFDAMKIPRERVELRCMNIYELRGLNRRFDQIICSETLEHIAQDGEVVQMFADMLNPGGRLLLCAPYARHPEHNLGRVNEPEEGGHVRDGYTIDSYLALLRPAGLRVTQVLGLGAPLLCEIDRVLRKVRMGMGDAVAMPLFLATLPLAQLDHPNPRVPFSLAAVAEKTKQAV